MEALNTVYLRVKALKDVWSERSYQDEKWGGKSFDLNHTEEEWLAWINEYAYGVGRAEGRPFRERMVKAAALCVAAIEAEDVKQQKE